MRKEVQHDAEEKMKEFFPHFKFEEPEEPSDFWVKSFQQRHKLKNTLSTSLSSERIAAGSEVVISKWFLETYTEKFYQQFKGNMIANLDETMLISRNRFMCIVRRDSRYAVVEDDDTTEHVTMLTCVTTDGQQPAPLMILPLKTLPRELDEMVASKHIVVSGQKKGWITQETFQQYCDILVEFVKQHRQRHGYGPEEPFLLLGDSHSSRANDRAMEQLKNNNIDFLTFPAHCTHILQPLDVGIFGPFKKYLKKEKRRIAQMNFDWGNKTPTKKSQKRLILVMASVTSLHKATDILTVSKAFSYSGLHPRDPERVLRNPKVNHDPTVVVPTKKRKAIEIDSKLLTSDTMIKNLKSHRETQERMADQPKPTSSCFSTNIFHRRKKRKTSKFIVRNNAGSSSGKENPLFGSSSSSSTLDNTPPKTTSEVCSGSIGQLSFIQAMRKSLPVYTQLFTTNKEPK